MKVGHANRVGHVFERCHAGPAQPDLAQDLPDLIAKRIVEALGDAQQSFVKAHTGLNHQREQVGRFGQRALDLVAALADPLLEPQTRRDEPDRGERRPRQRGRDDVGQPEG